MQCRWNASADDVMTWFTPALVLLAATILSACSNFHSFAEARSPDGKRVARLTRPKGSMEPIYYSVRIEGAENCVTALLQGYQAESWVRMEWAGDRALTVRYGVPLGRGMDPVAPVAATGDDACHGFKLTIVEDPTLAPPAGHNAPGYERVQYDPKDPYKGGKLPANSAQRGRHGADPAVPDMDADNVIGRAQ